MSDLLVFAASALALVCLAACAAAGQAPAGPRAADGSDGWTTHSPREEIRPMFSRHARSGPAGGAVLRIRSARDAQQQGAWSKTFAIEGGSHYRFRALRKAKAIACPRRSCVVKITWLNAKGRGVKPAGAEDVWRPSYPLDQATDTAGWTEVADTYAVPAGVTQAVVHLQLRWAGGGQVDWAQVSLTKVPAPKPRIVRLATVHYRPLGGKTAKDNREQFIPFLEQAAKKKADLVVLGECVTKSGTPQTLAQAAEPMPGPSSRFFGQLAKKHDLYIVVGLTERDGPVIYNTACLLGPTGKLEGTYRKVCLPREEIDTGTAPGHEYPVFRTRFGMVGMMVCWDVFFPEVARALANHGAEVIALPIAGGSPDLARARAIENQIYLVSSTYTDPKTKPNWMKSGVWDHEGKLLCEGKRWGTVLVAEVDLNKRTQWWWLGDFKARVARERPLANDEVPMTNDE